MFLLYADRNQLTVTVRETLTSGSVNVARMKFEFSPHWEGLAKQAVFVADGGPVSVLLPESGICTVPWEVLTRPGPRLMAGVCGTRGEEVVLPTVWASCGPILEGAVPGTDPNPPTPGQYEQMLTALEGKQDKLTGRPGQLVGFDEAGRAAAREGFALPPATAGTLGGVKIGAGIAAAPDGTIRADTASDAEVEGLLRELFGG
ncbi:MAG: hypothetical protein HFF39_08975 [Lawsonibacter sp.]|nr:hypothetical protein [Lawsonibacter sp.]